MKFVLDASVAIAWCFNEERTNAVIQLLEKLETESAIVPLLWSLEISNVLIGAIKRNKISYAEVTKLLSDFENLNIYFDDETAQRGFHEIVLLAHSEGLTTYDAAYLELALRKGIPLASKDKQLCQAAAKLGVKLLDV